jgi:hypothetical protein
MFDSCKRSSLLLQSFKGSVKVFKNVFAKVCLEIEADADMTPGACIIKPLSDN